MTPFLIAFLWTLAFETPVYALMLDREARAWPGPLLVALALNAMTHPLFSWWTLTTHPSESTIFAMECAIFVVEGLALAAIRRRNPRCGARGARLVLASVGIAFVANAMSYGLGRLLFA